MWKGFVSTISCIKYYKKTLCQHLHTGKVRILCMDLITHTDFRFSNGYLYTHVDNSVQMYGLAMQQCLHIYIPQVLSNSLAPFHLRSHNRLYHHPTSLTDQNQQSGRITIVYILALTLGDRYYCNNLRAIVGYDDTCDIYPGTLPKATIYKVHLII